MALLETKDLTINFGGLTAVSGLNLALNTGDLHGLIGPNGAGKTTVFNMITGVYLPSSGSIIFDNHNIIGLQPHEITKLGIARTFQNIRLFKGLSVLDNIRIALHMRANCSVPAAVFRLPQYYREEHRIKQRAMELLKIFGLQDLAEKTAGSLPYGQQRRLEIARALATDPKLLLLDEPAAGMNPQETKELMALIRWIRKEFGLTILLIEHHMEVVMGVCEHIKVLDYGVTIAEGPPEEIKKHPKVIEAYLGEEIKSA
ncbi:MAG TPA: ABC transporter ATP-binding protein [Firmicutes bacterium]|nr:ABC transporter ATP-binding protein [Bacillota bacterium]